MNKYELAEKDYKNGMKYKDIADKYGVTINTVKSWKQRYSWTKENAEKKTSVCTQNKKSMHIKKDIPTKQKKEIAKVMIEEGYTLKETMVQTGLSSGSVSRLSSKENLQNLQFEYLKKFREEQRDRIRKNKLKRLYLIEEVLKQLEYEVFNGECDKSTLDKLKLSEEIEQLLFKDNKFYDLELMKRKLEIEEEKLEIEKLKLNPQKEDTEDNILQIEVLD